MTIVNVTWISWFMETRETSPTRFFSRLKSSSESLGRLMGFQFETWFNLFTQICITCCTNVGRSLDGHVGTSLNGCYWHRLAIPFPTNIDGFRSSTYITKSVNSDKLRSSVFKLDSEENTKVRKEVGLKVLLNMTGWTLLWWKRWKSFNRELVKSKHSVVQLVNMEVFGLLYCQHDKARDFSDHLRSYSRNTF